METLSVDAVAKMLGFNRITVYRAIKAGAIPSIRFGRKIRISAQVVDALLRGGNRGIDE